MSLKNKSPVKKSDQVICPLCKQKVVILYHQFANGQPTGDRFLAFHQISINRMYMTNCALSGQSVLKK